MRKLLVLCLCVIVSAGLFGCGGKKTGDAKSIEVLYCNTLQPISGKGEDILAIPEKQAALLGGIYKSAYQHTTAVLNDLNEQGISVNYLDWGWGEQLRSKQTTALLNRGPEVFMGEAQMVEFAKNGGLLPFPDELADWVRENCFPGTYKSMEVDGKIYGVAPSAVPSMLVVNKALADMIWLEGYEAPATWADWLEQMDEVNNWNKDKTKNTTGKNVRPGGPFFGVNNGSYLRTVNFFQQQGVTFFNEETGAPEFTGEGVEKTLQFFRDIQVKNDGNFGSSEDTINSSFIANEMVFKVDGAGSKAYHATLNPKQDVYVVPCPSPTATASDAGLLIATVFYGIPKYVKGEKADSAFEYIRAMLTDKALTPIRDSRFKGIPKKSLITEEWFESQPEYYRQTLRATYAALDSDNMGTVPAFPYSNGKCWDEIGKAIKSATITGDSISGIAQAAQNQIILYYNNK